MHTGAGMRLLGVVVVVVLTGCVTIDPMTTTTVLPTQRVAFSTVPVMPQGFSGATGVGLGARAPLQPSAGGVAYPLPQWELGGMVPFADRRTSLGGFLNVGTPGLSHVRGPDAPLPGADDVAVEGAVNVAHDLPFSPTVGLTLASTLGITSLARRTYARDGEVVERLLLPQASAGAGLYGQLGVVRPYAALSIGTSVVSDPTGLEVRVCQTGGGSCSVSLAGNTSMAPLVMAGAGVRVQPSRHVSFTLEVQLPITSTFAQVPPSFALTVRALDLYPPRREPAPVPQALPPPPPPPPESAPPAYNPL